MDNNAGSKLRHWRHEAGEWLVFAKELVRDSALHAPAIFARAINARIRSKIRPEEFSLTGPQDRRFADAADTVPFWPTLRSALMLINKSADGGRLIDDKLITAERYLDHGIAAAPIIAVLGRDERRHPPARRIPSVNDPARLAAILEDGPDDIFFKPAGGKRAIGIGAATRHEHGWVLNDKCLGTEQLAACLLDQASEEGLLLQPRLQSHPAIKPLGGGLGLCSMRITTALLDSGPVLLFHFLKLLGQPSLADNFSGGTTGNLLAAIDPHKGIIRRVYARRPGHRFLLTQITHHPLTGVRLVGATLPLWQEACDLALRAAAVCPESPLAGADVALTDQGPMILEINALWDSHIAELTQGVGMKRMLRPIWPQLAVDHRAKRQAAALLGL